MPLYRVLNQEGSLQPFRSTGLGTKYLEQDLENWIERNPEVLLQDEPVLIIGRQVSTPVGVIDLLALDSSGAGLIIELKRAPSQRDAIGQSIEYASWLSNIGYDELHKIAEDYLKSVNLKATLEQSWSETFGNEFSDSIVNKQQRIFIVIEGENDRMKTVVQYLRTSGLDINMLTYFFYRTGSGEEILNIETQVGSEETNSGVETRPTEDKLFKVWDAIAVDAYKVFKDRMLNQGLFLKIKKTGVSFSKQTREYPIFVCYLSSSKADIRVWLRSDSLKSLIGFDSVSQEIREILPSYARVTHTATWFIITLPASLDGANKIADIIIQQIIERLENAKL